MDRVFSARIDESVVGVISILANELHATKKQIVESAIKLFADKVEKEHRIDVLDLTFGTWERDESAQSTVTRARKAFRNSMSRHHV